MARILVIEDAEPIRNDILEMLHFEGFEVLGAENGIVGIDSAFSYQPDLIICDIMMPELDGYGVLDALRKDERTVGIPFIFLTARTDRTDIRHGMGLGADDYLTKPFAVTELLETIRARLAKKNTFAEITDQKLKELSNNIITALPHELRTPLNTIIGFSDMLVTESHRLTPEQIAEWAEHINLAAQRLYRLVENYLTYVRTEIVKRDPSEMTALTNKYVDHPDAVVQFHAMHKAQQASREKDMILNVGHDSRVWISDHDLGKIVEELIDNALKFSEPGNPVILETKCQNDAYILQVKDNGRGMTLNQIKSIGAYMQFERWFYEQQGSGLGLAIVKRLVDLYNGTLSFENTPDGGTCVTITLALA